MKSAYIIKRSAPSVVNLIKYLQVDKSQAIYIRQVIHTSRTAENALKGIAQSDCFFNAGIEFLVINPYDYPVIEICTYINTGDTYSSTLIAKNNRVYISCWGDELEIYERKHGRVEN